MAQFTITGEYDPLLHVRLEPNESIYCETDAMVSMETSLDLGGSLQGGLARSFMRKFTQGESFFQQSIKASKSAGECLLAPTLPGGLSVLEVGPVQYSLADGTFLCATANVSLKTKMQNVSNSLFGKTGGYLIAQTSGEGQVVVSGFGSLTELEVTPDSDILVDNGHVVCWDSRLSSKVTIRTSESAGLIETLINSQTSGEGLLLRFSGTGKVVICSRNRESFLEHLKKELLEPPK